MTKRGVHKVCQSVHRLQTLLTVAMSTSSSLCTGLCTGVVHIKPAAVIDLERKRNNVNKFLYKYKKTTNIYMRYTRNPCVRVYIGKLVDVVHTLSREE